MSAGRAGRAGMRRLGRAMGDGRSVPRMDLIVEPALDVFVEPEDRSEEPELGVGDVADERVAEAFEAAAHRVAGSPRLIGVRRASSGTTCCMDASGGRRSSAS